jgi:primosomal protein N'
MTIGKTRYCTVVLNHFYGEMEYIAPMEEVLYRRVLIPVSQRIVVGIVMSIQETTTLPAAYLRSIISVIDPFPLITSEMATTINRCSKRFMADKWHFLHLAIPSYYLNKLNLLLPPSNNYTVLQKMQASPFIKHKEAVSSTAFHKEASRVYNTRFMHNLQKHNDLLQLDKVDYASLKDLYKRGYIEFTKSTVSDYASHYMSATPHTPEHTEHLKYLKNHLCHYNVSLVCSNNRQTRLELNMDLIEEVLHKKGQILLLSPTVQSSDALASVLSQRFAVKVGVINSYQSLKSQAETINLARWGKLPLVVSTRLGILLPFKNLRLIIIEDEHNPHHKHYGAKTIYCVREAVLIRAHILNIPVIMSSNTLSSSIFLKAQKQEYKFLRLHDKPGAVKLEIMDTNKQQLDNLNMSSSLHKEIAVTLAEKKQVIVFLNRLGYARKLSCLNCNSNIYCPNCKANVTLVLRVAGPHCICRSCNKFSFLLGELSCQVCGGDIELKTMGTEKVEYHMRLKYPNSKLLRVDSQSEREINGSIALMQENAVDIIVATSKLNRSITFKHVGLVCVVGIDHILVSQDLGTIERTLGVIMDLAEAAQSRIIVQSAMPNNRYLAALKSLDCVTMINTYGELQILESRHKAYRAHILLQDPEKNQLIEKAQELVAHLKASTKTVNVYNLSLRRQPLVAGMWKGYIPVQADSIDDIYELLEPLRKERSCRLDLVPEDVLP